MPTSKAPTPASGCSAGTAWRRHHRQEAAFTRLEVACRGRTTRAPTSKWYVGDKEAGSFAAGNPETHLCWPSIGDIVALSLLEDSRDLLIHFPARLGVQLPRLKRHRASQQAEFLRVIAPGLLVRNSNQVAGTPLEYNRRSGIRMKLKPTTTTNATPPAPRIKEAVSMPTSARVPFTKLKLAINPVMCKL